jgi:hypothetical protein
MRASGRSQVVGDRADHPRAVIDVALEAQPHGVERAGGAADLGGARQRDRLRREQAAPWRGEAKKAQDCGHNQAATYRARIAEGPTFRPGETADALMTPAVCDVRR